jgi:4,5-DOPA dioxygenase extradiol
VRLSEGAEGAGASRARDMQHPAPELPELGEEVAELASPDHVGADHDRWDIDHGTWSVLVHAFPDADIPVVQLSFNAQGPPDFHIALGARLAALRMRGVLVLGNGNVVHNLHAIDWQQPDTGFDWNQRFDADARQLLAERLGDTASLVQHPDYGVSAPTPEHFLPVLYLAGIAAADALVEGCAYDSLSMTSYTVGADHGRLK